MKMIKSPLRSASKAARAALISLCTGSNGGLTHLNRDGGVLAGTLKKAAKWCELSVATGP